MHPGPAPKSGDPSAAIACPYGAIASLSRTPREGAEKPGEAGDTGTGDSGVLHERGIFSALFARDTTRPELKALRHELRLWHGEDLDLSQPLPSERILAAGAVDPQIQLAALPYMSMAAGLEIMRALEPRARAVYETGWRPPLSDGPTRAQLADTIDVAVRAGTQELLPAADAPYPDPRRITRVA